jgi:Putative Actinobacterial Holin-X, holin superfamily III
VSAAAPQHDPNVASLGADVANDLVRLVRAEINLAKVQLTSALIRIAIAAALLVVALLLLLFAVIEALGTVPSRYSVQLFGNGWLGWLILGGLFFVLALVFGLIGTLRLRAALRVGKQTLATLKEDSEWVKHLTRRAGSGS